MHTMIFLATCKKSKKSIIYISDEAVHSQLARPRDEQTDRKQTFHRTTTLQAGLINQVDNDYLITVLTQTLPLASSPNFWVNS